MVPRQMSHRRTRIAAIGAAAFLMIATACEAKLPSSPEVESMDVAKVENSGMAKVALGIDTLAAYYVDGERVSPEAARTLAGEDIGSIRILKATAGNEIRITTKAAMTQRSSDFVPRDETGKRQAYSLEQVPASRAKVPLPSSDFAGLVLINGRPVPPEALARLSPDDIESVDVLKGDVASRMYDDPKAANGVIRVTTKR